MARVEKKDVREILILIRANYQKSYETKNNQEEILLENTWYEILKDYDLALIKKAFLNCLKSLKFAPKISDIIGEIEGMKRAFEKSDLELWDEFVKAVEFVRDKKYYFQFTVKVNEFETQGQREYRLVKEYYEKLDELLKCYFASVDRLVGFAEFLEEDLQYEKGRFLQQIKSIRARQEIREQLPAEIKTLISDLTNKKIFKLQAKEA